MATGKRFYWIKLRNSFYFDSDFANAVDFLMSQKNGANYIILYQMLCLMTANTGGVMANSVGEMIVPYDPAKIARECKWFDFDTVVVALELYKKLGWVYQQEDGILRVVDFDRMVGSETDYAVQKQNQRLGKGVDNVHADVHTDVHQEIRDKSLDFRDESLDKKTTTTERARVREKNEGDELIPKGERAEHLKQRLMGGTLGQGLVRISDEQFDDLCERLSVEEMEHYFAAVVEYEKSGKRSTKSHYNAILDMVKKDRRVKKDGETND